MYIGQFFYVTLLVTTHCTYRGEHTLNIYTIGHSTHPTDEFLEMLHEASIEVLVDIRSFPASRKFPQFNEMNFRDWLKDVDIAYEHFSLLGGRRNKSQQFQDELNDGWNNQSFHNYADYTLTKDFQQGIRQLKQLAKKKRTVICCSERHPARCHRLLISNWLTAHGWNVYHIIQQGDQIHIDLHELGQWGAMPIVEDDGTVVYPHV